MVLLIFLRLAEDIVQIQNVPDKRRKEVFKGLCMHLKDLFPFFLNTLSSHYEKYCEYVSIYFIFSDIYSTNFAVNIFLFSFFALKS